MQRRGVRYLHGLLKQALIFAVNKGELAANPAKAATMPFSDGGKDAVVSLTHEQERRFLEAAKKNRWSALWHVLLDTGLRPGEAFALKWEEHKTGTDGEVSHVADLDGSNPIVKVRGTLMRRGVAKEKHGGLGWYVTAEPKTENSVRDIPICDDTVAELRRWKKQQDEERKQMGREWQEYGFVFTTEFGTPLGNNMGRAWEGVLREADRGDGIFGTWGPEPTKKRSGPAPKRSFTPRYSMYVLRHTMITLNFLDGMDLGLLSRRAGHSNYFFTFDRYGRGVTAALTKTVAENTQRRWQAAGGLRLIA